MRIVIDGNIGSGKTTQLGLLEKKGWEVRKEPIEEWPLKEFYEDQVRWAFLLHMRILQTMKYTNCLKNTIYERSMWSSRWVFWPLIQDRLHPIERDAYEKQFREDVWFPDIYIYLAKDPGVCLDHIMARGQTGDGAITLEYLNKLDEMYKTLVESLPIQRKYVVDANQSVEKVHQDISKILEENELLFSDSKRGQM